MTITISLSPEVESELQKRAAANGQDATEYIRAIVEKELLAPPTVDELLAPFRRQVEESQMTDDELDAFVEEVREEVWREKQGQRAKKS